MDDAVFTFHRVRRKSVRWAAGCFICCAFATVVTCAFLFARPGAEPGVVLFTYGVLATALAVQIFAVRAYRNARVVITSTGVDAFHIFGTDRIPFDEIAGFELDTRPRYARPATLLRLTAGRHGIPRSVELSALSAGRRDAQWRPTRVVNELKPIIERMNAELDRRRLGPSTAERLRAAHPAFEAKLHGY